MPAECVLKEDTHEEKWTHVCETIRMLFLAIAQIEIALRESDRSIDDLTEAFTFIVERENEIAQSTDRILSAGSDPQLCRSIRNNAEVMTEKMRSAIVAFQFYDKLTQRLGHVGTSLEEMCNLLGDISRIDEVDEWRRLQAVIKSKYSMREEHELFNAVTSGADVREAIRQFDAVHQNDSVEDIEMF